MTKLLVKLFVKDYKNTEKQEVRTSYGILTSVVGIISNLILFIVKIAIGIIIRSISVIGDAFNNLSDAASSVIGFFGVKIAGRPADKEHPFGHGRAEYIASLIVAFLIIQVGFTVIKNSTSKIFNPEAVLFNWTTIIILSVSVFIKLWLAFFNSKLGKRINSTVMKATATDSLADVLVTSATIISIIIEKSTTYSVDGWMGIIVGVFVTISGLSVAKETLLPLMGEAVNMDVYKKITKRVESYDGIIGSHDLIVHNYGPNNIMATIHAEIPNDADLEMAHETIDLIERDVLEDLGILLVIHMDPIEVNDLKVIEKRDMITNIVTDLEAEASIHDFRVVNGERKINLIFDLVVPHSYDVKDQQELLRKLIQKTRKVDYRYDCIVTIESSFIADN